MIVFSSCDKKSMKIIFSIGVVFCQLSLFAQQEKVSDSVKQLN